MAERRSMPKAPGSRAIPKAPGSRAIPKAPGSRTTGPARRITSLTNASVKEIRGLWLAKNRKASGLFLAEGLKLVTDAIASGWQLVKLVHAEAAPSGGPLERAVKATLKTGGEVLEVSPAVLAKISRRDNPQTVIGVFRQSVTAVETLRPRRQDTWVALESVRDPGNLGTIIRTVDAVGAAGVILVGATVDPFSVEAVRATMGSIFHVPLVRTDTAGFTALARGWPGAIAGTHLDAGLDYRQADYRGPCLLVMGAEQSGLTDQTAQLCNTVVKIPMAGQADSLNLAVATAVMLFEIRKGALTLDG